MFTTNDAPPPGMVEPAKGSIGFGRRPHLRLLMVCGVMGLAMALVASVIATVEYVQASPPPAVTVSMCQVLPASDVARMFGGSAVGSPDHSPNQSCTYTSGDGVTSWVVDIGMTGQPAAPGSAWAVLEQIVNQALPEDDHVYSVEEFGDAAVYSVGALVGYPRTTFLGIVRKDRRDWLITITGLLPDSPQTENQYVAVAQTLTERIVP